MLILLTAIKDKKKSSKLEYLYTQHVSCMYKVAHRILNDNYLAQDAVHEAFVKISNHLDKINEADCNKTRAFLVIIVRNVSIDIYRRRKIQESLSFENLEDRITENDKGIEEIVINNETFARITEIIKELHPTYADILALKYFYHYEDAEISQILNITPENFRTRLHRARHSLIKQLSHEQEAKKHE